MTLKDLARQLGLSPTTVSRALNDYPEVNAETRARVKTAAREAGYVPNIGAQRLATGRAKTIGHVVVVDDHQIINPFFAEFIAGAGETYAPAGYEMTLSIVPGAQEMEVYRSMAARRSVDGVILHNSRANDPRIALLQELNMPFVVHGRSELTDTDYLYLDIANTRAFEHATNHLLDLGHKRIALLNGLADLSFAKRRRAGVEKAMAARQVKPEESLMFSAEMSEGYGYQVTSDLLASSNAPTAVITSSILTAAGAARAVADRGLTLGRDLSLITHDDVLGYFPNGTPQSPVFTATRSSIREAGKCTAQMLIAAINDPDTPPPSEVWTPDFVIGRSTGAAPF
ncbi:MAG: substrate-binding domain-containing protein [Pseudomonadota bacterium]